MKKIIYSFTLFLIAFICVDKVYAHSIINPAKYMVETSSELEEVINQGLDGIVESPYNYGIPAYNYIVNTFLPNELYLEYGDYYLCRVRGSAYGAICYITNSPEDFYLDFRYSGQITNPIFTYFGLNYISKTEKFLYRYIIDASGKKSSSSGFFESGSAGELYGDFSKDLTFFTNINYFKLDDPNYNTIITSDNYYFNNGDVVFYESNGQYKLNTSYKTVDDLSEVHIYDDVIEDTNYSKMIFTFDLDILEEKNNVFDVMLEDFYTNKQKQSLTDHPGGVIHEDEEYVDIGYQEIPFPYLEYELLDGSKDILYLKNMDDSVLNYRKNYYYAKYLDTLPNNVTSLKLILPMNETVDYLYTVRLYSLYSFEVSYESDNYDYWETIDVSGNYGVVFMPKITSNNSYIYSYFQTRGIESISVYDSYNYKEKPIEVFTENTLEFNYGFSLSNTDFNLFFKVKPNDNYALIDYDTRYFTYKIFRTQYSAHSVVNPNNDDDIFIDISNIQESSINFSNIGEIFDFISEKIDRSGHSYFLFANLVDSFFGTMPIDIYVFLLLSLCLILIGTLLVMGGWK